MAKELQTEDKLEYTFLPLTSGALHFQVKAKNDAHLALTTSPGESDPMYEVFIGGWNNSRSAIRKNRTKPDKASAETPGILTDDEYKRFWIRWDEGVISVGFGGQDSPFLSFKDPEPFPIGYYGIRTGWGAEGRWIVEGTEEKHEDSGEKSSSSSSSSEGSGSEKEDNESGKEDDSVEKKKKKKDKKKDKKDKKEKEKKDE